MFNLIKYQNIILKFASDLICHEQSYSYIFCLQKQKMKKAINFIAQCANKIAAHGTKVKTATQARKKPRKKPEVELESATAPEKLKCAENTPNEVCNVKQRLNCDGTY